MTSNDLAELKERLRQQALSLRDGLDKDFRRDAARRIAQTALDLPELAAIDSIGAYWPIRSEVDSRPLMEALVARGQEVALSQIIHPHLSFRLWQPGDPLIKGGFGVHEPETTVQTFAFDTSRALGRLSASVTFRASDGPTFVTVTT